MEKEQKTIFIVGACPVKCAPRQHLLQQMYFTGRTDLLHESAKQN